MKDTASFFSFYEVVDKISIILGTFSFGLITNITGNMRMSVLVLGSVFLLGLVILRYVKIEHATGLVEEVEV